MDNVIPFPQDPKGYKKVEEWLYSVCNEVGLSDEMISNLSQEFREYYDELFVSYEASMNISSEVGLNQHQADAISKAYSETVQKIFKHHAEQMGIASRIIIGLLAREQLNNENI